MKRARNMPNGFSLLEIIVSTAIVGIVLVAIGEAMSTMQNTWVRVRGKADMFRPLRTAADTMNRRLALATLESRWVTEEDAADGKPTGEMVRESDLHFVSGPALKLTGSGATLAGHAIFFQAPFGVDAQRRSESAANSYDRLGHLLNAWGYFVEYGPEPGPRPAFMNQSTSGRRDERRRFRLMEYRQPTEELSLFAAGSNQDGQAEIQSATGESSVRKWLRAPLQGGRNLVERRVSVLAENIVALVVRPLSGGTLDELARTGTGEQYDLAQEMEYDSRRHQYDNSVVSKLMRHRLPPALEVTLVATSEDAWARLTPAEVEQLASEIRGIANGGFKTAAQYENDIRNLARMLDKRGIEHRVLRSVVTLAEGTKE